MYSFVRCHIHSQGTIIHKASRFLARLLRNIGDWLILSRYASDKFRISTNKDVPSLLGELFRRIVIQLWRCTFVFPENWKIEDWRGFFFICVRLRFFNWGNKDRDIYTIAAPSNGKKLHRFCTKKRLRFCRANNERFEGWVVSFVMLEHDLWNIGCASCIMYCLLCESL